MGLLCFSHMMNKMKFGEGKFKILIGFQEALVDLFPFQEQVGEKLKQEASHFQHQTIHQSLMAGGRGVDGSCTRLGELTGEEVHFWNAYFVALSGSTQQQ